VKITPYKFLVKTKSGDVEINIHPAEFQTPGRFEIVPVTKDDFMSVHYVKNYLNNHPVGMFGQTFNIRKDQQVLPMDIHYALCCATSVHNDPNILSFDVLEGFIPDVVE
jgi:hypothetical protein